MITLNIFDQLSDSVNLYFPTSLGIRNPHIIKKGFTINNQHFYQFLKIIKLAHLTLFPLSPQEELKIHEAFLYRGEWRKVRARANLGRSRWICCCLVRRAVDWSIERLAATVWPKAFRSTLPIEPPCSLLVHPPPASKTSPRCFENQGCKNNHKERLLSRYHDLRGEIRMQQEEYQTSN